MLTESLVLEDPHGDKLSAGVELDPQPWHGEDDPDMETEISEPVVYVTGDAYLDPEKARSLADALRLMADEVDRLRSAALDKDDRHAQH